MKTIEPELITKEVSRLCIEAANIIDDEILKVLRRAKDNENPLGCEILSQIIEND